MLNLLVLNAGTGTLLVMFSLPLILRWIEPNAWCGFRAKATLNHRDLWHAANACAGRLLLVGGLSAIMSGVGLYFLPNVTLRQYSLGCLVVAGIVLVAGLTQTVAYLRALCRV